MTMNDDIEKPACATCAASIETRAFPCDECGAIDEDDDGEPIERPPASYTVAVYLCDRAYGGPEEGGWWYDTGCLSRDHWHLTRVFKPEQRAEALAYCRELNDKALREDNKGRPPAHSVNSIGVFVAQVYDDFPPAFFPQERPRYE
jgi:hypothetical protein